LAPATSVILEGVFGCFAMSEQYDEFESEPEDFLSEPISYIGAVFMRGGRVHFLLLRCRGFCT
jgi:hypothetical protein